MEKKLWTVLIFLILKTVEIETAYLKNQCGFHSANYSIEWAFEPQTQSVVFVLRTSAPTNSLEKESSITGIGIGHEQKVNFIGIFAHNDGLVKIVSAESDAEGQLKLSPDSNKVKGISLKKLPSGDIIAEFARSFDSDDKMLLGCLHFYFPIKWLTIDPDKPSFFTSTTKQKVCEIAETCRLDASELREGTKGSAHRDVPVVAQSVDISGKGDPCSFTGEDYAVKWSYNRGTDSVEFVMKQKPKMGQWWSAIGIGDNMSDLDIGVIFLNNGVPEGMNDYYSSSYDAPVMDAIQDWEFDKVGTKWNNDVVELHFLRKIVTNDAEKDRSMDGCVLFQFAANSGTYANGKCIHKHENWPDLYKVCGIKKRCARQKRENSNEITDDVLPKISLSTDGRNGSQSEIINKPQKNGNNVVDGDRVISLLMKSLGPKIVQTVAESEELNIKNSSNAIQKNGQEEIIPSGNGGSEYNAEFKPAAEKKQELEKVTETLAVTTTETAIMVEETYSSVAPSVPSESSVQQNIVGGSPFSLNAFLGNQTDGNLSPVGEPAPNIGLNAAETSEATTTTTQARFGINQMIGEESARGTDEAVQNAIEMHNETTGTILQPTVTSTVPAEPATNVTVPLNPAENATAETDNSLPIQPLNDTTPSIENDLISTSTIASEVPKKEDEETILYNTTLALTLHEENATETSLVLVNNLSTTASDTAATPNSETSPTSITTTHTESSTLANTTSMSPTSTSPSSQISEAQTNSLSITTTEESTTSTSELSPNTSGSEATTEREQVYSTREPERSTSGNNHSREVTDGLNNIEQEQSSPTIEETSSRETRPTIAPTKETGGNNGPEKTPQGHPGEEGIKLPVSQSKCDALRPDLPICRSYMENYLSRVKEWANKHGEHMEKQFGKACKLLAAVPHVPTLCCQIFAEKCVDYI